MSGTIFNPENNEHLEDLNVIGNKSEFEVDTRKWKCESYEDSYYGNIAKENLHGFGVYSSVNQKCNFMYEGYFYANNYDGYAKVTFEDCSYFEGLFKNNSRFGPGVLSHSSGLQDVGMWNGPKIARLATVVLPEWIPSLASSNLGKVNLLKYRKIVSIREENINNVLNVSSFLQSENYITSEDLCNYNVQNSKSLFFHKKSYDQDYFGLVRDFAIDVSLPDEDIRESIIEENISKENIKIDYLSSFLKNLSNSGKFSISEMKLLDLQSAFLKRFHKKISRKNIATKKVDVTELLAWNNEPLSIEFLKHTFTCRNQEPFISFDMEDILIGNRQKFGDPGEIECACISFLTHSCYGENSNMYQLYINFDLDVNLCDAKGNTAVMFAAAHDKVSTISLLVNLGGNIDAINDEGLTPLTLCLLRYISLVQNIEDWESAFIDTSNKTASSAQSWRPRRSVVNMFTYSIFDTLQHCESLFFKSTNEILLYKENTGEYKNEDVAELYKVLGLIRPPITEQNFQGIFKANHETTHKNIFKIQTVAGPNNLTENEDTTLNHTEVVYNTIRFLLHYGAKGTIGNVPLPPIILSLYINKVEILKEILKTVDVNSIKLEHNLTPLHYIVNMEPHPTLIQKCRLLLQHGADPNCKTHPIPISEEMEDVLPKSVELELTPLQMLSMRNDFIEDLQGILNDVAKTLIEGGATVDEPFASYTPLAMAIGRGNYILVETLLRAGADPNIPLGELGVPLTLYIVEPFQNKLPPINICKSVIDKLIEYLGNPLLPIGNSGNVIEFIKAKKNEKSLPAGKIKESKNTKIGMKVTQSDSIKEYLIQKLFDVAMRHYQSKALLRIAVFLLSGETDSKFNEINTSFLTVEEAIQILQTFVSYKILQLENDFHLVLIFKILEYINKYNQQYNSSRKNSITDFVTKVKSDKAKTIHSMEKYKPFELDTNEGIYKFCFHCGLKSNKPLVVCKNCKLIYFCSSECEIGNHKTTSRHPCPELFYNKTLSYKSPSMNYLLEELKKALNKFATKYNKRSGFISTFFNDYPQLRSKSNNATNNTRVTFTGKEPRTPSPHQDQQLITNSDKSTANSIRRTFNEKESSIPLSHQGHFEENEKLGNKNTKPEKKQVASSAIDSTEISATFIKNQDIPQNNQTVQQKTKAKNATEKYITGTDHSNILGTTDQNDDTTDHKKSKTLKKQVGSKATDFSDDHKRNQDLLQNNQTPQQILNAKKAPAIGRTKITDKVFSKTNDASNLINKRGNKQYISEKGYALQDNKRTKLPKTKAKSEDEIMRPSSNYKKEKSTTTPLKIGQNEIKYGSKKPKDGTFPISQPVKDENLQYNSFVKDLHSNKPNITEQTHSTINQTGKNLGQDYEAHKMRELLPTKIQNLPQKVQLFALKLLELYPDFDVSNFFKPFVCFSNGELYYKFKGEGSACANYTRI